MKGPALLQCIILIHFPLLSFLCAAASVSGYGGQSISWDCRFQSYIAKALKSQPSLTAGESPNAVESMTPTIHSHVSPFINRPTVSSAATVPRHAQIIVRKVEKDIDIMHERRLSTIIGHLPGSPNIAAWLTTLGTDGKWPSTEIDYTTGCGALRANWPAQAHWQRLVVMAGAWHGGLKGAGQYVKDVSLRAAISLAMDFWFARDFTNPSCLDSGGTSGCPCSTPGFWNTNWFSNIILIPELVGETCLLLNDTLSQSQFGSCTRITGRAYGTFDHNINGAGYLTGANALDVAKVGINQGLLSVNVSLIADAYQRLHKELAIKGEVRADGIRPDGSFGQHQGIIYNGNYGKDYIDDILDLEIVAGTTQFAASRESQNALATLFDGNQWMIYHNVLTGVLHWDFSVLGRFISFPVADDQATASIQMNLTAVRALGHQWSSSSLINFANTLSENTSNANAGKLEGNRVFFNNDYVVHRGHNYVSTLKMFSSRTTNTECSNRQNPLGFHLADGVSYTYLRGDEYEDVFVAWDWNLIPGITVDYGATPLTCDYTQFHGVESFVGGVSDGKLGLAVMRYTNPFTQALHWQKVWFYLDDDVQHVMIANITSLTGVPVYSVLDQRRRAGPVFVDGLESRLSNHARPRSLWHGDMGYSFPDSQGSFNLSLRFGEKSGNWSTLGTSVQTPTTVNLFAAWLEHDLLSDPISYNIFPGTDFGTFLIKSERLRLQSIQNDAHVSALFDDAHSTAMVAFWNPVGGSVHIVPSSMDAPITIAADKNIVIIYRVRSGNITISDPSQMLRTVHITLTVGQGRKPPLWGNGYSKELEFVLPEGGLAGSSISQNLQMQRHV